jgi:hypothetical protein
MRTQMHSRRAWRRLIPATLGLAAAGVLIGGQAAAPTPVLPHAAAPISQRPELITPEAERAIENGLAYLARTQSRDGAWRSQGGYGSYPVVMTSLAGLALMAGGNTPVEGRYSAEVRRAVDFVIGSARANGLITSPGEESRSMYGHGFGMLFLAEAYGMEADPVRQERIARILEKAAVLTGQSQSAAGGWLYTPDSGGDEGSVTVTQIQGLRAARNAGIKVDKSIIDKAVGYIAKSANPDGGIRYQARGAGNSLPAITAAAVATLYNAGDYDDPMAHKALQFTKNRLKQGDYSRAFSGHVFYSLLYTSQAMYLSSEENWVEFFPTCRDWLIKAQAQDGSWTGDGVGQTYGTAIGLLILQLPYRNLPILQR